MHAEVPGILSAQHYAQHWQISVEAYIVTQSMPIWLLLTMPVQVNQPGG